MRQLLLVLGLLVNGWILAQSPAMDIVSDDRQYVGTIGNLPIELNLLDAGTWQALAKGECVDVMGNYFYHSTLRPIFVQGRACLDGHTISLSHTDDHGLDTETFEGTWNADATELKGNWTLIKNNKVLPFSLKAYHLQFDTLQLTQFFQFLQHELAERDYDGYRMSVQDVLYAQGQGKLLQFESDGGHVGFLSLGRLELQLEYSNAGNGTMTTEVFQLLPSTSGVRILYVSTGNTNTATEGPDGELTYEESCDAWIKLMMLKGGDWQEAASSTDETGAIAQAMKAARADECIIYTTTAGAKTGAKLLRWDGQSLVLK